MQFVPEELRDHDLPCRLIPLNQEGESIGHLYHYGTQAQLEEMMDRWLRSKIGVIEAELVGKE
jgi:hypothetical protein